MEPLTWRQRAKIFLIPLVFLAVLLFMMANACPKYSYQLDCTGPNCRCDIPGLEHKHQDERGGWMCHSNEDF